MATTAPRPQASKHWVIFISQVSSQHPMTSCLLTWSGWSPLGSVTSSGFSLTALCLVCLFLETQEKKAGTGWLAAVSPQTRLNSAAPKLASPPSSLWFPTASCSSPIIQGELHSSDCIAPSTIFYETVLLQISCSLSDTLPLEIISCWIFLFGCLYS